MMSGNDVEVAVEAEIPDIEVGTNTTKGIGVELCGTHAWLSSLEATDMMPMVKPQFSFVLGV